MIVYVNKWQSLNFGGVGTPYSPLCNTGTASASGKVPRVKMLSDNSFLMTRQRTSCLISTVDFEGRGSQRPLVMVLRNLSKCSSIISLDGLGFLSVKKYVCRVQSLLMSLLNKDISIAKTKHKIQSSC